MPPNQQRRKQPVKPRAKDDEADRHRQVFATRCADFRRYYTMLGKGDWWWIMDDSQEAFGAQMLRDGHLVIDDFLPDEHAALLHSEVVACHKAGNLHVAGVVDGHVSSPVEAKYQNTATRGDVIGWFDSDEQGWPYGRALHNYLVKVGTMLSELGAHVPELKQITSRSKVMVACYPGGGARYIKHVDNDGKHPLCKTRLLTGLLYLNPDWKPGDGGELAIYEQHNKDVERRVVEPLCNRLLLFWSDWRTPHEVRPASKSRYAVTLWFLHKCTELKWAEEELSPSELAAAVASTAGVSDAAEAAAAGSGENGRQGGGDEAVVAEGQGVDGKSAASSEAAVGASGGATSSVRHEWRRLGGDEGCADEACRWELLVEVSGDRPECPALEVSDREVNVVAASGELLLCSPLPKGKWAAMSTKWSRKRASLTTVFEPQPDTSSSSSMPPTSATETPQVPGEPCECPQRGSPHSAEPACRRTAQGGARVRHSWRRLRADEEGSEDSSGWELCLEVLGEQPACPVLEVSDTQVHAAAARGDPLLCVPLPRGTWASPTVRWSRKRGVLTATFEPVETAAGDVVAGLAAPLVVRLSSHGWGVIDRFLSGPQADALRQYVLQLRERGRLKVGSNRHEGATGSSSKNDEYAFLEPADAQSADAAPLRACVALCNRLSLALVRGVPALRGVQLTAGQPMVAVYPGDGARYGRHFDATVNKAGGDNGRVLTLVVYLNPFWKEQDGGGLRIFEPEGAAEAEAPIVEPLHGRLVGFLCRDRCPHEVLPAWSDRAAVTFWYYDGDRLSERCRSAGADGSGLCGFGFEEG